MPRFRLIEGCAGAATGTYAMCPDASHPIDIDVDKDGCGIQMFKELIDLVLLCYVLRQATKHFQEHTFPNGYIPVPREVM